MIHAIPSGLRTVFTSATLCKRGSLRDQRVCPSVTSRYSVKTKKVSVMISSPSGSPTILVFWYQIESQNSKGSPRAGPQTRVGWEI